MWLDGHNLLEAQNMLVVSLLFTLINAQTLLLPPPQPSSYPSSGTPVPGNFITGAFLQDPLITNAVAYVNAKVPASLLSITPSKYVLEATVNYTASTCSDTSCPDPTCYWF